MGCLQNTLYISVHSYIIRKAFLFLGACTQYQKSIISFIMFSVRKEHIGSKCMEVQNVLY